MLNLLFVLFLILTCINPIYCSNLKKIIEFEDVVNCFKNNIDSRILALLIEIYLTLKF